MRISYAMFCPHVVGDDWYFDVTVLDDGTEWLATDRWTSLCEGDEYRFPHGPVVSVYERPRIGHGGLRQSITPSEGWFSITAKTGHEYLIETIKEETK